MPLKRLLGAPTAWCVSMGVAIGSGIFRTPGEIAEHLRSPGWIMLAWLLGGAIVLMQGMVTAEVATRFPQAGGEYVFLREAYGTFFAFFFGWAYTVFVIGAGSAVIAIAFGDFACELFRLPAESAGLIAVASVAAVTGVNIVGLRTGAYTQDIFTVLKILALLAIVMLGFTLASPTPASPGASDSLIATPIGAPPILALLTAMLPVLWSYDGTTDSIKLAEEIRDVRRAVPLALLGSTIALTLLYMAVNLALLQIIPVEEMAGLPSAPGTAMERLLGPTGRVAMLLVAMLVCLGSLSSTIVATVRVTFALARDGLTFRWLGRMSQHQAPVPALIVAGVISGLFCLLRDFTQVLGIYFLASTLLYGLSYGSLIVFRVRDGSKNRCLTVAALIRLIVFRKREAQMPADIFHCPAGPLMAIAVIVIQVTVAVHIAVNDPRSALYTIGLLVVLALLYVLWRRTHHASAISSSDT